MKKVFGVIFLLVGLFLIVAGVAGMSDVNSRQSTYDGQISENFDENYSERNSQEQEISGAAIILGLIFSVIGIIMLVTKSNKQRQMQFELSSLKQQANSLKSNNHLAHQQDDKKSYGKAEIEKEKINKEDSFEDKILKIEKLVKLKEEGHLSSEEFEKEKSKILS